MKKEISRNRKVLFYVGTGMMVLGFILFISTFFTIGSFTRDLMFGSSGFGNFITAPIGMVLMIVGGILRSIGVLGAAGSGAILDPERAREDLKPHSTAIGGIISDVMDETPLGKTKSSAQEVVKVRCQNCSHLNVETAKFCSECGHRI